MSACFYSPMPLATVEEAVAALRAGKGVVVVDDFDRENEGDIILAADVATPEAVAHLVKWTSGVVCAPLPQARAEELGLPPMVPPSASTDRMGTAFTVSVDVNPVHGTTTGIAARERVATARALSHPLAKVEDFSRPGHVFPLTARTGGVLVRGGHTEAGVDLPALAGFHPVGILAEITDPDDPAGDMARLPACIKLAKEWNYPLLSIADIRRFRAKRERLVRFQSAEIAFSDPSVGVRLRNAGADRPFVLEYRRSTADGAWTPVHDTGIEPSVALFALATGRPMPSLSDILPVASSPSPILFRFEPLVGGGSVEVTFAPASSADASDATFEVYTHIFRGPQSAVSAGAPSDPSGPYAAAMERLKTASAPFPRAVVLLSDLGRDTDHSGPAPPSAHAGVEPGPTPGAAARGEEKVEEKEGEEEEVASDRELSAYVSGEMPVWWTADHVLAPWYPSAVASQVIRIVGAWGEAGGEGAVLEPGVTIPFQVKAEGAVNPEFPEWPLAERGGSSPFRRPFVLPGAREGVLKGEGEELGTPATLAVPRVAPAPPARAGVRVVTAAGSPVPALWDFDTGVTTSIAPLETTPKKVTA